MAARATREPEGAENAGPLAPEEVVDAADTSPRAPKADTTGKRVRAIPGAGGTTVKMTRVNFNQIGLNGHPEVVWDFRKDRFTVLVGEGANQIHPEAADYLCKHFPMQFEYMSS